MIQLHLTQTDALDTAIEARTGDALSPFRTAVSLLTTMPDLSDTTARVPIAEIGTDMTRLPSGISSPGRACPRFDESASNR